MKIKEDLIKELKIAMQEKDIIKKETITGLRAAILQVEKDSQRELLEDEINSIVAKEVKKRKESLPEYEKAQRKDLIDRIQVEINILEKYLPEQLSKDQITLMVRDAIKNVQAASVKDMGRVMQEIKAKTQGRADGKLVSDVVREELNNL